MMTGVVLAADSIPLERRERARCVAVAFADFAALDAPIGIAWVRPARPGETPDYNVDLSSAWGLITRGYPGTIFVDVGRATEDDLLKTVIHEVTHVAQLYGRVPTAGPRDNGHEVRARMIAQDVVTAYADYRDTPPELFAAVHVPTPLARLTAPGHPRCAFYEKLRAGELAHPVTGGWERPEFWGQVREPEAPQPTGRERSKVKVDVSKFTDANELRRALGLAPERAEDPWRGSRPRRTARSRGVAYDGSLGLTRERRFV